MIIRAAIIECDNIDERFFGVNGLYRISSAARNDTPNIHGDVEFVRMK